MTGVDDENEAPMESGSIDYTERAFAQDSEQAIRGDVVRALIELITNADDAYKERSGDIQIRVRRGADALPLVVEVRDAATGLGAEELKYHFATLGRTKAEEDVESRGLLGRGAKDCASLGRLVVHAAKGGLFSTFVLERTGKWMLTAINEDSAGAKAAAAGFLPTETGLAALIELRPEVRVLSADKLAEALQGHAQLRELLGRHRVTLEDRRKSKVWQKELAPPRVVGEVVYDEELPVAGYGTAHLTLRRLPAEDLKPVGPWSQNGLLVASQKTIYENTWFDLDRGHPESGRFAGVLRSPEISQLVRDFDKEDGGASNPTRLLARDRDGLVREHPYTKALVVALAERLLPIFDEEAKRLHADEREGQRLRKDLDGAASALRDELRRALEEIDEEPSVGEGIEDDEVPAFMLIPPRRRCRPGESLTFTVRSTEERPLPLQVDVVSQTAEGVVIGAACPDTGWSAHPRLEAFVSRLLVDVGPTEGVARVAVKAGGVAAYAEVVVDDTVRDLEPPSSLEFMTARATVSPLRGRRVVLRAPLSDEGLTVGLALQGTLIALQGETTTLRAEPDGRWVEAKIRVVAGQDLGTSRLTATAGGQSAQCSVEVVPISAASTFDLKFSLSGEAIGVRSTRRLLDPGLHVEVYAKHPSFNNVFGPFDAAAGRFRQEDSPEARAVLAEVIADELACHLTEQAFARRPDLLNDASRVLRERTKSAVRFLPILHRALRQDRA